MSRLRLSGSGTLAQEGGPQSDQWTALRDHRSHQGSALGVRPPRSCSTPARLARYSWPESEWGGQRRPPAGVAAVSSGRVRGTSLPCGHRLDRSGTQHGDNRPPNPCGCRPDGGQTLPPVKTNTPVAIRRTCVEADAPVPVASKGWAGAIDDPTIAKGRAGAIHPSAIHPRRAVDPPPHHDWGRAVHDPPHDDGGGSRLIDDRRRRHGGVAVIVITGTPAESRTAGQATHKSACRKTSPKAAPPPATWAVVST